MKHIKTILALLLCLCMLPLSAFAYTVEPGGAHASSVYTPAESGLYAVSVTKDGETLSPLPAQAAIYDPAMAVSVKAGGVEAQAVDYNVFYLVEGTTYTVQLEKTAGSTYDDSGEWDVSVSPVKPLALTLNADTLVEGEWFSFTPEADGSYTFSAAPAPVFVEIMTLGTVSGDWTGYALDKERCLVGMELDYLRSLKAAMAARAETLAQAEDTYQKALDKLENYQAILDEAQERGLLDGSNYDIKKQAAYAIFKAALRTGSIIGIQADSEFVNGLPERYTELPAYLTEKLNSQDGIVGEAKAKYEEQKAQQEADQARYDAGLAANPQLEAAIQDTTVETSALRQQVKTDADTIMSGAAPFASGAGMQLVAAEWLNTGDAGMTAALKAGTTYIVHALTNLDASVSVTDGTEEPPVQTVDKTALNQAIAEAKAIEADQYTDASVAAMNAALADAEAVQKNDDATQAEVNAAANALNDAIQALEKKQTEPTDPPVQTADKTALQQAIAEAEAVDTAKYTEDSVAAMNAALQDAKAVNSNADATQAEVDHAAAALNAAVKALKEKPVDKTALQAAIDRANALDSSKYTDTSFAAVTLALATANIVNLNPLAKQERVDEVTAALNEAIDALVEVGGDTDVDKSALEAAVTAAEAVDRAKYTSESLTLLDSKLTYAKTVLADADASQTDVDSAEQALRGAIAALEEKPVTPTVDKTALNAAIAAAEQIDRSKYTDASLREMDAALNAAKATRDSASAEQAAVDVAAQNLNAAIAALQDKPVSTVDKSALQEAVDKAKAIDRSKYTDESLAALDAQVRSAETVLANANATQAQVNLSARRVNSAVSALQEKQPVTFVDVPAGAYYADAVDWAVENGITNGTDATHFSPKADCTRAQIVTFLWRTMGEPEPATLVNPFSDVFPTDYYYKAVLWAVGEEITNGTDATHFSPKATCTRAHAVTFLWRMEGEPMPSSSISPFDDVKDQNAYYYYAVMWAVEKEITNGTDAAHFSPKVTCSRAQIVTFLYRDKVGA